MRQAGLFRLLSPADFDALWATAVAHARVYRRGDMVMTQGGGADGVVVVIAGLAAAFSDPLMRGLCRPRDFTQMLAAGDVEGALAWLGVAAAAAAAAAGEEATAGGLLNERTLVVESETLEVGLLANLSWRWGRLGSLADPG